MATSGTQTALPLAFGVVTAPKDAPQRIVGQIEDAAQAIRVSLGNRKLTYIAEVIGISPAYLSRLSRGKRKMPEEPARRRIVDGLCRATGSNLLRQYLAMQEALEADHEARLIAELEAAA